MNFSVTVDQMGRRGMGFRRLAIIETGLGDQPMREVSHRWVITNGEIYNHAELRAELEALGCNFATRSDTEVLINAVARVGRGCTHLRCGRFGQQLSRGIVIKLLAGNDIHVHA
jgi:asparagine synthase (glutamine-hydrolysing)